MAVARKKGLPELKHHLLPRTRGFVLTMHGVQGKGMSFLESLHTITSVPLLMYCYSIPLIAVQTFVAVSAILDITCGFRKEGAEPTLMNILNGKAVMGEMYVR